MADESIELEFVAATEKAQKAIDKLAGKVDDLDESVTVDVDADTADALTAIGKLERELDGVTDDTAELRIRFKGEQLQREIGKSLRELEKLDDPIDIQTQTQELERAQSELRELAELAERKYEIEIDADPARNVQRATGDMEGFNETAQRGIGPLRGLTDELGESAGQAGVMAAAAVDAGEAVEIFGSKVGLSEKVTGKLSRALSYGAGAVAAAALAWNEYNKIQQKARERVEETRTAIEKLRDGSLDEAAAGLTESLKPTLDALERAGFDAADAIKLVLEPTEELQTRFNEIATGYSWESINLQLWLDDARKIVRETNEELEVEETRLNEIISALEDIGYEWSDTGRAATDAATQSVAAIGNIISEYDRLSTRLSNRSTVLDLADAFDDVEAAAAEAWEAASTGADDADRKVRDYERAQIRLNSLLLEYGEEIGRLPAEVVTELIAEVDQGSFDNARLTIEALKTPFVIPYQFVNVSQYPIPSIGAQLGRSATGTAGTRSAGGDGEAAAFGAPAAAMSTSPTTTARRRPFTVAPASITNVTVNVPNSLGMRAVDSAVERWRRINGNRTT